MTFASEKLYNGYLRRSMPTIVTKVKVREIIIHLPCLTAHDRENIEAKRETNGNFDSMVLLLDCLKRRENWPEQFIEALEACEHTTLAAEIRAEYDTLKGTNNSNPNSPPTTVIRAHVHPAPSASPLSVPESHANGPAAAAPLAEASAPPDPAAQASPPPETPVQPQAPEAVPPPEPVPEPPLSGQVEVEEARPSTPPKSPQREINIQQEPEENSESDIQVISGDNGVIPDQESVENSEVSIDHEDAPQPPRPVEQCETDTPTRPDPLQTTTTTTTTAEIDSDVTDGSSFPAMTPEKPPVQDTTPLVDLKPAAVLQPEETSEPPATRVVESSPPTDSTATTYPLPAVAAIDFSLCDDSDVCLSKPGQLVSIYPQNNVSPNISEPIAPVQPFSGDSDRLEISDGAPDTVTFAQPPACSALSSTTVSTASALPCQENGVAVNHNEPEENHYESPCHGSEMEEVMTHVVHVSEEPSILDLDGQSLTPQAQIVNGEAAKEITSAPPLSTNTVDTVLSVNTTSREDFHPSEPAPADSSPELKTLQDSEKETASCIVPANAKYILTAAGVGACALLLAWRFRN
ncbi:mitochondrial antiviral-signaling protein isoform X2 [Anoplopoma fimbria]|uniref:mitochondrial antiviral-signaling protein isoform X2 n=1 Tax=Anoplopoma fimbria TaxID=229290 RepID=UPI0023EBC5DC|nr:mitochondrial antiviral-signaling protein isoform X2 [Anoplopoma fimbria]